MENKNILFVDADDMAKHNFKFTKRGKYFPKGTGIEHKNRIWCWNCKLYFLKKDYDFKLGACKECIKDGFQSDSIEDLKNLKIKKPKKGRGDAVG